MHEPFVLAQPIQAHVQYKSKKIGRHISAYHARFFQFIKLHKVYDTLARRKPSVNVYGIWSFANLKQLKLRNLCNSN